MENEINWFSVLLTTFLPIGIGLLYFHPRVFGKFTGITSNEPTWRKRNIPALIASLALSFLLSVFLLNFNNDGINQEGDFDTFRHGAWHGVFVALLIAFPVTVTNGFFGRTPWKKIAVTLIYWIIVLALMGGILDAMNHWENIPYPEGWD